MGQERADKVSYLEKTLKQHSELELALYQICARMADRLEALNAKNESSQEYRVRCDEMSMILGRLLYMGSMEERVKNARQVLAMLELVPKRRSWWKSLLHWVKAVIRGYA